MIAPMLRLSRAQLREVDRIAIEEYGLPGIVLMENAARAVADEATRMLEAARRLPPSADQVAGFVKGEWVTVFCGGGNNGGDGLAVARHLHNRGVNVAVLKAWDRPLRDDALTNWRVVERMGLPVCDVADTAEWAAQMVDGCALLIDALFGTGLRGPLDHRVVQRMDAIEAWRPPILSVDVPSGLDCDTGEPVDDACFRATRTVTFVAEKLGFANPRSREFTGEVVVADIGCPREIIDRVVAADERG